MYWIQPTPQNKALGFQSKYRHALEQARMKINQLCSLATSVHRELDPPAHGGEGSILSPPLAPHCAGVFVDMDKAWISSTSSSFRAAFTMRCLAKRGLPGYGWDVCGQSMSTLLYVEACVRRKGLGPLTTIGKVDLMHPRKITHTSRNNK